MDANAESCIGWHKLPNQGRAPQHACHGQVVLVVSVELLLLPTAHGAFLHLCARPLFAGLRAPPTPAALILFSPMSTILIHWLAGVPHHNLAVVSWSLTIEE